jgi:hypothetical protein
MSLKLTTDQVLACRKKLEGIIGPYAHLMSREELQKIIENIQEDPFAKPVESILQKHRFLDSHVKSRVWAAKDAKIINDLI